MGNMIILFAAACTGMMVFCLFKVLFDFALKVNEADLESSNSEFNHQELSLLLKLGLPGSKIFRYWVRKGYFVEKEQILQQRLGMAGLSYVIDAGDFLALQFYYYFVGAVVIVLTLFSEHALIGWVLGVLFMFYPTLYLNGVIKNRHLAIMKALPNMLDLLTLSVEAGKDFVSALRDILAKRRYDALTEEFSQAFQEIQLGRNRADALRDMAKRVGQSDLTSVLNAIIQAEELGVSIAELLRIQGDMLRNKRFSLAEKLANEAPVKIIFPIILFIFPAVMIILFGPIIMQALDMF